MKEELEKLRSEKATLEGLLAEVDHKIKSIERTKQKYIQATCNHNFRYEGHGHNDDCYKCSKCELTEWR